MPPGQSVEILFDGEVVAKGVSSRTDNTYGIRVAVPATSPGTYPVAARLAQYSQIAPAQANFRAPCSTPPTPPTPPPEPPPPPPPGTFNPTIALDPTVSTEGGVAIATGAGWPPGQVVLAWDVGGGDPVAATANASGSFTVAVLVLPNSGVGPRVLNGAGGPASASAGFLVVPATMQPPGFTIRG